MDTGDQINFLRWVHFLLSVLLELFLLLCWRRLSCMGRTYMVPHAGKQLWQMGRCVAIQLHQDKTRAVPDSRASEGSGRGMSGCWFFSKPLYWFSTLAIDTSMWVINYRIQETERKGTLSPWQVLYLWFLFRKISKSPLIDSEDIFSRNNAI